MKIPKSVKQFFTFTEPKVEPGFVLAWDEPEEVRGTKQKDEEFFDEQYLFKPGSRVTGNLTADLKTFQDAFPNSELLGRRDFSVAGKKLCVLFLFNVADPQVIRQNILESLSRVDKFKPETLIASLSTDHAGFSDELNYGLEQLLQGNTVILLEGEKKFIVAETKGAAHRPVSEAVNERVVKGPQEGFNEDLTTNLSLVQKRIRTHRLAIKIIEVGTLSRTRCAILSVNGITNPRLVAEVKRRVSGIKLSHLTDSGMLEQFIEDSTLHPFPQMLSTERPDRVASALAEGKVAVLVDGSNTALVMPVTAIGLIHTAEDYNVRWPYGIYLRLVRIIAVFALLLLPAIYIASNLFQPEMIPTDLLFSLIAIKQRAPIPSILEVVLVELILEIVREANFRAPRFLAGPLTIIVLLLIALVAVFFPILNPMLLLVVLVPGLAGFVLPELSVSPSFRMIRHLYTALSFMFGFIGIAFGGYLHLQIMARQKSFGVPMLAPIGPFTKRSGDIVLLKAAIWQKARPDFLDPLQAKRQPEKSQLWKEEQEEQPYAPEGGDQDN